MEQNETSDISTIRPGVEVVKASLGKVVAIIGDQMRVADTFGLVDEAGHPVAASPTRTVGAEHAFGQLLALIQRRERLADRIAAILDKNKPGRQLAEIFRGWLATRGDAGACSKALAFSDQWLVREAAFDTDIKEVYESRDLLPKKSLWITAGDEWSTIANLTSIHHLISSGEDINLLLFMTDPTTGVGTSASPRRDIGLYALNYGGVYVASCSPACSEGQFEQAVREADSFPGTSLVLVYVPSQSGDAASAHEAVDQGKWPLYRWDPRKEAAGENPFTVDSGKVREEIAQFLDRENQLSLLARETPAFDPLLASAVDAQLQAKQEEAAARLKASYDKLLGNVGMQPLAILYGSDGGNAEGVAKRTAAEAKKRGFTEVTCRSMDAWELQKLAAQPLAVIVVSTAGQGEFPMNARSFWKQLSVLPPGELDFSRLRFAVFGLGDSNYWPRKEQRIYYNKPSSDLEAALVHLGAVPLLERGLGDDQETGGFAAGFQKWAPGLWAALGVGLPSDADTDTASNKIRGDEDIKGTSNYLRGTILQGLGDDSTGALCYEDTKLTKFHGIYQQDDRDLRGDRKRAGLEPAYSFMVRVRIPGGVCSPAQYLALDKIADTHANGTIRATTRQAVQFHGIIKKVLKPSIASINRALMDTLAACGDVNRNVMCNANPEGGVLHQAVLDFSRRLSDRLSPRTTAYHEVWLDEKLVGGGSVDVEPIYGKNYLPRKFKIAVAVPPSNDVDVFAHDLGFVAVTDDEGELAGFTVTVGGGMGMTHNNVKTYPRLGEPLCYADVETALAVAEAVVTTQRDYGDRTNRKHARLKYTIDDRGLDWFRSEVEARMGRKLDDPKPFVFSDNNDRYGWVAGSGGDAFNYTLFIQNGRIKDFSETYRLKSGLRAIARVHKGDIRFTPNQNIIIAGVTTADKPVIDGLLAEYGIENGRHTGLKLSSMACVAMPTCALALAESERYLPKLLDRLDVAIEEAGLHSDSITIRMTGCPNGCARPYVAEIGLVGRSPGIYNLYLGAGHAGDRLNKLHKESVDEEGIVAELVPLIRRYALERSHAEHFGDWVIRAGIIKPTTSGRTFHDL